MIEGSTRRPKSHQPQIVALPIGDIVPDPNQPRKTFAPEELSSLANSLLKTGQINPIVVRPLAGGKHMIVIGERRWRAAKETGLSHLDCVIRHDIDDRQAREMQFAENCQREDIPPLEQARSFKDYLNRYKVSQSELSRRTGIPQRSISNRLALLSLPSSLQARIEAAEIGPYEAVKIAALPADQQEAVAQAVASGTIGGRDLEKLMQPRKSPHRGDRMTQEVPEPANVLEANVGLSQRLDNLGKAIYKLAASYAFNEAAKEREQGARKAPPCPECLKRGESGYILGIRTKMTPEDRREFIESIEDDEELTEEDKADLLEPEPTHIIEAKCHKCGYKEFIGYAWE